VALLSRSDLFTEIIGHNRYFWLPVTILIKYPLCVNLKFPARDRLLIFLLLLYFSNHDISQIKN